MVHRHYYFFASALSIIANVAVGDEMAFVDISSKSEHKVRYLDNRIRSKAGIAGLFDKAPMASHEWVRQQEVNTLVAATVKASGLESSKVAQKIDQLQKEFEFLYGILPKNKEGVLAKPAARYLLHRYFSKKYGWWFKGLTPAGNAWVSKDLVTPEVKQLSKFIVPGRIFEDLASRAGTEGIDLKTVSVAAAVFELLVEHDLSDTLYSAMKALEIKLAGKKTPEEVDDIIAAMLLNLVFGADFEVSTKSAVQSLRRFLDSHHSGWNRLWQFTLDLKRNAPSNVENFDGIFGFLQLFAKKYNSFHSADCTRVVEELQVVPGYNRSRVPLRSFKPSARKGFRTLFTEQSEALNNFGILANGTEVLISNYINSAWMCMNTATYFVVCCPNACEEKLDQLEKSAQGGKAKPEQITQVLQDDLRHDVPKALAQKLYDVNQNLSDGMIPLHGPDLAQWLHQVFPSQCPLPNDQGGVHNPRSPSEWMTEPHHSVEETEESMVALSAAQIQFNVLDLEKTQPNEGEEDREFEVMPMDTWTEKHVDQPRRWSNLFILVFAGFIAALVATIGTWSLRYSLQIYGSKGIKRGKNLDHVDAV